MNSFVISYPGSTSYEAFTEDPSGSVIVDFVSFDRNKHFSGRFVSCELSDLQVNYPEKTDNTRSKNAKEYQSLIRDAVDFIIAEKMGKIVLTRFQDLPKSISAIDVYQELVRAYPSACVYLFSHEEFGTWIGATPEVLLKGNREKVYTMSLAGTKVVGSEVQLGAKEEAEQGMVTDFILGCFGEVEELSKIQCSKPHMSQAGNLLHIQTDITAEVGTGFSSQKLIDKLHPTPAVAGLPRERAIQYLSQFEDYKREFYSGYFGIKQADGYSYFVNLRCLQIFKNEVRLYAGGGITSESDPHSEWLETENKLQTIRRVLP